MGRLERVPESNLHHARSSLNRKEVAEAGRSRRVLRVKPLHESVNIRQMLSIGNVENFPTQLKLVIFTPGHGEGFRQAHVDVKVPGIPEYVAISALAGTAAAQALISRGRI
jgi:hypothetical protein